MRRDEAKKLFFIALYTLLFLFKTHSQKLDISATNKNNTVIVNIVSESFEKDLIFKSLSKELVIEIEYVIKIYQKTKGIYSYFGDQLIAEKHPTYTAKWDLFFKEYSIKKYNGKIENYPDKNVFLKSLFKLKKYLIYFPPELDMEDCYITAQVKINTMKLFPPFNLITLFVPSIKQQSEFHSSKIIKVESDAK